MNQTKEKVSHIVGSIVTAIDAFCVPLSGGIKYQRKEVYCEATQSLIWRLMLQYRNRGLGWPYPPIYRINHSFKIGPKWAKEK